MTALNANRHAPSSVTLNDVVTGFHDIELTIHRPAGPIFRLFLIAELMNVAGNPDGDRRVGLILPSFEAMTTVHSVFHISGRVVQYAEAPECQVLSLDQEITAVNLQPREACVRRDECLTQLKGQN